MSDFRINFTDYSLGCMEFKSVEIFAISLFVTKIYAFEDFLVFLTVHACSASYDCQILTVYSSSNNEFGSVGIFQISLIVFKI